MFWSPEAPMYWCSGCVSRWLAAFIVKSLSFYCSLANGIRRCQPHINLNFSSAVARRYSLSFLPPDLTVHVNKVSAVRKQNVNCDRACTWTRSEHCEKYAPYDLKGSPKLIEAKIRSEIFITLYFVNNLWKDNQRSNWPAGTCFTYYLGDTVFIYVLGIGHHLFLA